MQASRKKVLLAALSTTHTSVMPPASRLQPIHTTITPQHDVYTFGSNEVEPDVMKRAALSWGRAMANDTICCYVMETPKAQDTRIERFFGSLVEPVARAMKGQSVWTLHDKGAGFESSPSAVAVACVYPQQYPSTWELVRTGLVGNLVFKAPSLGCMTTFLLAFDKFDQLKAQYHEERGGDFLYVCMFGTVPEQQGRGVGSALMRAMTAEADARGLPMYLEASDKASAAFYARHGFALRQELHVCSRPRKGSNQPDGVDGDDAPPRIYVMVRAPRSAPAAASAASAVPQQTVL